MNELDLFAAAIGITDPAERDAFLGRQCADRPELRQRLEALLEAHGRSNQLLDAPHHVKLDETTANPPTEQPGETIAGRYKLLELIGEGSMGAVWAAEQSQPVRRKVALKLIKAGMDSKAVLARFEAERQALAVMDHPNIAKVLDGGLTDRNRPFFVMEYVKGVPITDYCDSARLNVSERLALFVQVCHAVQHAHQKGIIHRDLKPSNILVAPYDDKPIPKIIDFGLAKAMHQSLTEKTLHTAYESVLGTPLYMSPEQAQLNNLDVDTRSDVYSLGVLLYELLTGTTPLDRQRFKQAAWDEVRRIIREEEPPRPSHRLSSTDTLASVAAGRHTEPVRLTKLVRGDLDWIVMKALEKDRTRRYETANGFAMDVQRYLTGEPVVAHPPSTAYRLKKFVRRHHPQVIAASLVLLALIAGVIGTSIGLLEARRQTGIARDEASAKETARAEAVAAAEQERLAKVQVATQLKQIELVNDTVFNIFEGFDIRVVKSSGEPVESVLAKKLLVAGRTLDAKAIADPQVLAKVRNRLGETLISLGYPGDAIELFLAARATWSETLGPEHPQTLISMGNVAKGYRDAGMFELALPLLEETLKLRKAKFGPDHPDTLNSMNDLASGYNLAGKLDRALPLEEETLKLQKAKLGFDHPDTLASMSNLATWYRHDGKLDLALVVWEETLERKKTRLGPDHPTTLISMSTLAEGHRAVGKPDRALSLEEETLKLTKAKLGPDHPGTLISMNNLASGYQAAGKLDLALPLFEETFERQKAKLGPDHPTTLIIMNNLATAYQDSGQLTKAEPLLEQALQKHKAKFGAEHPRAVGTMALLGSFRLQYKKFAEAEPLLRECLAIREKRQPDAWSTFSTQSMLGGALLGQKKYADAEPLLLRGYEGMKAREKSIPQNGRSRIPEALDRLIELFTATNNPDEVKRFKELRTKYPKNPTSPQSPKQ